MSDPIDISRPRQSRARREPPHDLPAERALLGCTLLEQRAVDVLLNSVQVGDFYKPAHQHIASAVVAIARRHDPVDTVTVQTELARLGALDQLDGGTQYLLDLIAEPPAITRAATYARTVTNHAARRRLIHATAQLTDAAYSGDDPLEIVVNGQALLADLAIAPLTGWRIFTTLDTDSSAEQVVPTRLRRRDGACLLYEGRENGLQGEPASGKTWIALIAAAEVLALGGTVVHLDLEDTAAAARSRLAALGVPAEQLARCLHTTGRDLDSGHELTIAELARSLTAANADMVLIDSVAEAFTRWGLDEDKADDANTFREALVKPLTRTGTTVITLDHVAKNTEQRGRYARGTGAKLSGLDGACYTVASTGFNRTTGGRISLKLAKDRHGGLPGVQGDVVAQVWMPPAVDGQPIGYEIETPPPTPTTFDRAAARTAADYQLHDELRTAALDVIGAAGGPLSRRRLLAEIRARRRKDRLAGFADGKLDPVLADLEATREIVRTTVKGYDAFAHRPIQQALAMGEEAPE